MVVEHEILQPPADERRPVGERGQRLARRLQQRPRRILGRQRDVLHEADGGNAVLPGVVRRHVGAAHRSRHLALHAQTRGAGGERIERADHQLADGIVPAQRDLPGHRLVGRHRERGGVEDHQPLDLRGVLEGPAKPDHAAPVVHGQGHRRGIVDAGVAQQRLQVVHPRLQGVVVAWRGALVVVRLVRQAHADVVGDDASVAIGQARNERAPVVTPRRIAVQHDHDLAVARAFVQVGHGDAGADFEAAGVCGVAGEVHGGCRGSIRELSGVHSRIIHSWISNPRSWNTLTCLQIIDLQGHQHSGAWAWIRCAP